MRSAVADLGYVHPTPVQRAVFESAARGKDLVVQARTGTGKTAAFGLPLVDRIVRRKVKAVQALALCPTRELALQVTRELEALGKNTGVSVLPIYGGAPMPKQIEGLKQGAQILVGTPGRVLDHLRRKTLDPSKIRVLVLDECDEMLSMGFLPQILDIWNQLPKELQVLLFSATVPRPVLRVADSRLREPEFITLSGDQIGALEIEHFVYISQGDKLQELLRILQSEAPESAIIFCNTRDDTQRVAQELQRAGYRADWLNADLSQKEREAVMAATREGRLPFLVCTDVAARGIDISHLTHVINFDFPEATENYVHRTGRTGRAGRMGTAISLVSPSSIGNLYYLRLEYKIHPIERQLPSERELKTRAETDTVLQLAGRFTSAREAERSLVRRLLTHERAETIIAGLLREHLAANGTELPGAPRVRSPRQLVPPPPEVRAPRSEKQPRTERLAAIAAERSEEPAADRSRRRGPREVEGRGPREADVARASEARATRELDAERPGPATERGRPPEPPTLARRRARPARPALGDAGIRYEVRSVSDADLAGLVPSPAASNHAPVPESSPSSSEGVTEVRPDDSRTEAAVSGSRGWDGPIDEAFVNVGKDDGVRTSDVQQALNSAGVSEDDTAYVRIRQRHTFIGVRQGLLERVVTGLSGQTIAQREVEAQPARPRQARR
ncbi:MAG TPA: DEAD/DEAH box helicase [Polyangiaceae bacterium]|nr:DEAD/DEAH box helicase [Polyangiaceae bacterium]